jgi:hypothetical protein
MKKYTNFISEKLSANQTKYVNLIVNYLIKHSIELYEYDEEFEVIKNDDTLIGKLYLVPDNRAIRFNFNKNTLTSIDLWDHLEFNDNTIINQPNFTLNIYDTVVNVLDDILKFINGDFKVNETATEEKTEVTEAESETVRLKTLLNKVIFEQNIDVFDAIKWNAAQVASGISNSLVVSGLAGLGKTTEVENMLDTMHVKYLYLKGADVTPASLFETLFLHLDELIVFDDCDDVWDDPISVNMLKAALDTTKMRKVSRLLKTHFDSFDMTNDQIIAQYKKTGKLPKQFEFKGRVIFITNVAGEKLDKNLISRGLFVDVNLTKEQVIKRIKEIIPLIMPNVNINKKLEILSFMEIMNETYELRFALNLRTFIHCLNIALSNSFNINIGGESIPAYQMLIKQYLIK